MILYFLLKSAQTCYICGATLKDMNKFENIRFRDTDITTYRFGLSTLHAWIRFFECILHLSYRLDFKKWQTRKEDRDKLKARKFEIQKQFRSEMGLIVDQVCPGGAGTTNDGNTARRFFRNYEDSARITGIDKELIRRFGVILQALASGFKIDVAAFDAYCQETAKLYLQKYSWFYMPISVHKILFLGSAIISNAILPIGQLSEEAQEARNKDLKNFRRSHTRKYSRQATNEDLLHLLLVSSDPYITTLRPLPRRSRNRFSADVLQMLVSPEVSTEQSEEASEAAEAITTTSEDDGSSAEQSDYDSDY